MFGTVGTIQELAKQIGLRGTCEYAERPDATEWSRDARHYKVTLRRRNGRRITTPFSMGSAHTSEPEAVEVLDCLISDASCAMDTFEGFCGDMGYDTDSRKAERTYNACKRTADKLRKFLGDEYDAAFQVERL